MSDLAKLISPKKYYDEIGEVDIVKENDTELYARCPFHGKDRKRSFSINKKTGAWICFGKCGTGGSMLDFHAKKFHLDPDEALIDIKVTLGLEKSIPPAKVEKDHKRLLKNKEIMKFFKERRGLTLATLKRFEIGFDGDRITIPIKVGNHYLNIRRYERGKCSANEKMLSYKEGYGEARLWPAANLTKDDVLICEGEMDTLLACQMGFNAVTGTAGAGTWPSKFTKLVAGKFISICYDIDKPGRDGEKKIAKAVKHLVKGIKFIHLPITEPDNADLTDYIVNHGHTAKDFKKLIKETEPEEIKSKVERINDGVVHEVSLHASSSKKYFQQRVKIPVIVSGKDLAPYFVPKVVSFSCGMGLRKCSGCGLGPNGAEGSLEMNIDQPADILRLIGVSEERQKIFLKERAKIVPCTRPEVEVIESENVEQIRVIPEIEFSSKDAEYVTREIFVIGHGIKTNSSYTIEGTTIPDPKNQYATQVIDKATPNQLSMDNFKMTPQLMKKLKVFQPSKRQTIKQKLDEIYRDFTFNVTNIYNREDLIQTIDLTYHSVLQFKFSGKLVRKGWTESLILGDTRCGKSETIEGMIDHYRAGELVTAENTSYAGLVGGMQQTQQRWSISWGKIPLSDRRLIAMDEVSGLTIDQISLMSGIRSSGVAEITKIQSERTHARTRLIWLSNPRSGRRLDSYNHGVLAVKELIGRVEDIARFDIAVTAASGEVPADTMRKLRDVKVPHRHKSEFCNQLILWAWSRSSDQINITDEAEEAIYDGVEFLDKKYSSAIPLVEPSEQRIKLARLSTALAVRLFSTEDGETVIVTKDHVAEIMRFLQQVFDKGSMGYDLYSKAMKKLDTLPEKDAKKIEAEFKSIHDWDQVRDLLLDSPQFRRNELADQLGLDQDAARDLFKWFGKWRLIRSTPVGYVKHSAFTSFLKSILDHKYKAPSTKGERF